MMIGELQPEGTLRELCAPSGSSPLWWEERRSLSLPCLGLPRPPHTRCRASPELGILIRQGAVSPDSRPFTSEANRHILPQTPLALGYFLLKNL